MKSILILFQSIFYYLHFISMIFPVISIVIAWKKGLIKLFDSKLFALYVIVGFFTSIFIFGFAWFNYLNGQTHTAFWLVQKWVFRFFLFFQHTIIVFLFLKWAKLVKYFPATIIVTYPLLFAGDYFAYSEYPQVMFWISRLIILFLAFNLNYLIDKGRISELEPHYNYIFIGTYLYCLISLFGITPNQIDLRNLGYILNSIAVITSSYYYFLAFRSLYKKENLSIISNTQIIS